MQEATFLQDLSHYRYQLCMLDVPELTQMHRKYRGTLHQAIKYSRADLAKLSSWERRKYRLVLTDHEKRCDGDGSGQELAFFARHELMVKVH